ncbi:MAG: Uma2 family endonuclease [Candidatus Entotheonellia bacterium]
MVGSPIRSLQDFAPLIQLACITDEWSQALSVVREHRLGRVFVAPLDIVIRRDPLRTRQPDLMFISKARRDVIGLQVIDGGPDLVIAVLSPTNTRLDLQEKVQIYQTIGVRDAWIVSPQAQTVEVFQLPAEGIQRSGLYGRGHLIVSQVLPKLQPEIDELFPAL